MSHGSSPTPDDVAFERLSAEMRERSPDDLSPSEVRQLLDMLVERRFLSAADAAEARAMLKSQRPGRVLEWIAQRKQRPTK